MTMKALAFLLAFGASVASASAADPDLAEALEARYGPFPQNASLAVTVTSKQAFPDGDKFKEDGLPEGFLAVVWDRSNSRFAALVENPDGAPLRISGTAALETEVPVLLRRISSGETVTADDVQLRPLRIASVEGIVAKLEDVVGKQATKPIAAGQPIKTGSLTLPSAVTRNGDVTVIFRKGPLELTAKGKSLSDAALGETVKVMRPSASKVLEGVAVAEGVVLVSEGIKN